MKKMLILDDMPGNIKMLEELLKDKYEIIFASNGKKAIRLAKELMPDLILMDMHMPKISGYTASQIIKNDSKTAKIPILLYNSLDRKISYEQI